MVPILHLNYDTLPLGSDIRYELLENAIRITIPASDSRITLPLDEIPIEIRRTLLRQSATWAALLSTGFIAPLSLMLGNLRIPRELRTIATGAFIVFGLAFFALVWRTLHLARCDTIAKGRRQLTFIDASPAHISVETAGPFGTKSHHIHPNQVRAIKLGRLPNYPPISTVHVLAIHLTTGQILHVAPARLPSELTWLAQVLRERTGSIL